MHSTFWFSIIIGLTIAGFLSLGEEPAAMDKSENGMKARKFSKWFFRKFVVFDKKWPPAFLICVLVMAYSIPIAEYSEMGTGQNIGFVTSIYHPSMSMIDTGNFLSAHSGEGNVLELPIITGDYLINSSHSFWAVTTPLYTFTTSFIEYRVAS